MPAWRRTAHDGIRNDSYDRRAQHANALNPRLSALAYTRATKGRASQTMEPSIANARAENACKSAKGNVL